MLSPAKTEDFADKPIIQPIVLRIEEDSFSATNNKNQPFKPLETPK